MPDLATAESVAAAAARDRIDLASGVPLRVLLLAVAADANQHVLVLCLHHIAGDGWSYRILLDEVAAHYKALLAGQPLVLPALSVQYRDYAAYRLTSTPRDQADRQFWHSLLAAPLPLIDLPADRPRPALPDFEGEALSITLDAELTQALLAFGRQGGLSLYMTLLTALYALLYRYTGQSDLIVGSPVAGRDHPELELQIGFFVGLLPLRIAVDGTAGFAALAARVRTLVLGAFTHRGYPFDRLVNELPLPRDPSRSPLFDVLFVVEESAPAPELPGLSVQPLGREAGAGKLDLGIVVVEHADGERLTLRIDYRTRLCLRGRGSRRWRGTLPSLFATPWPSPKRPSARSRFCPLANVWRRRCRRPSRALRARWGKHFVRPPKSTPRLRPLWKGERHLAMASLWPGLPPWLLPSVLRVESGAVVGVLLERGLSAVVAQVAIQLAGAVYLPLDPAYPASRLRQNGSSKVAAAWRLPKMRSPSF